MVKRIKEDELKKIAAGGLDPSECVGAPGVDKRTPPDPSSFEPDHDAPEGGIDELSRD